MSVWLESVVSALVETIVRERCSQEPFEPAALRGTIDFVLAQKAGMPDYLQPAMQIATLGFDLWSLPRTGRRFHRLSHAQRWRQTRAWSTSSLASMRDLIKFFETLAVFGWYSELYGDHPRSHAAA